MDSRAASLLKYRFGNMQQMHNHLHVVEGRTLFFYRDPHICTACRYRADDMLWRCPHCHEWNTFVEERLGPGPVGGR